MQQNCNPGQLVINSHGTPAAQWTPLGVATNEQFEADTLFISGTNVVVVPEHQMPIFAGSISISNGGELSDQPTPTNQEYSLLLTITNNLLIDASSSINVSGTGYLPGYTLGNTTNGAASFTAGGSYGGLGGLCCGSTDNAVYGDYRYPNELGSGSGTYSSGGIGGGLVQITAAVARVDGTILADGLGGNPLPYDGGSGGGILLNVGTLVGAGQISANGGDASGIGAGGGGRVAIYYNTSTFNLSGNVSAYGGTNGNYPSMSASAGTVYFKQAGSPGQLVINNRGTPTAQWTPLGVATNQSFEADTLIISGTNVVVVPEHQMPIFAGSVSITSGGQLSDQPTTTNQEYSLILTVTNNLLVDGSSSVNVSLTGYLPGYTLGNTTNGAASLTAGGSYGGLGGLCCGSIGNAVYGDYHYPNELGSGSGTYSTSASGGGLVQITAGAAQVDGAILANGGNGYDGGSGGGGILLNVGTLSGAGQINANGGNSIGGNDGGGGGRVAIYYGTSTFNLSSNVTAYGGVVPDGVSLSGSAGTVYLQQTASPGQLVINNNGSASGQLTLLGQTTDSAFTADTLVLSGAGTAAATISGAPIQVGSISLLNGAVLSHLPTTANQEYSLVLTVTNRLLLDASSSINVSGLGYLEGYTLGNTTNGAAFRTAGGSYGGLGGLCCQSTDNAVYGDYRYPNELGSGSGTYSSGGIGGGLVQITAAVARVDGTILADGLGGNPLPYDGGSGGGILLNVGTLVGAGQISANGGDASGNGAGGGGRVAIYYNTSTFNLSGNVSAYGGTNGNYPSMSASAGTVYFKQAGSPGQLVINNRGTPTAQWTPLGVATNQSFEADTLIISGTNVVVVPEHQMPIFAGSISIANGGELSDQPTTTNQEYSLLLTITNNLLIDASSSINVSGTGYLPGYTLGNTTNGAASFTAGGSYGGLGGLCCGSTDNALYGDYHFPNELGSGSGTYANPGTGGGLVQIMAGSAQVDGAILADGFGGTPTSYDGGSGGGILLNVGTLSGTGQINANGGSASGNDGGGGGRVAIYTWTSMLFPAGNVLANSGIGPSENGQNGTVYIASQPYLTFLNVSQIWHGSEQITWSSVGIDPNVGAIADVVVSKGGVTYFQQTAPSSGSVSWNTATVADGTYTLTVSLLTTAGQQLNQISQIELINNTAAWHEGTLSASQTWGSNTVNAVDQNIIIPNGVTLTIAPGAIIKFANGTGIIIQPGGTLDASAATVNAPIIFTSLEDSTVGGNTDEDANNSVPLVGDWNGITVSGQFLANSSVQIRYVIQNHSGTLSTNQEWFGAAEHLVTGNVIVPSGVTLTIDPGAIVKFNLGLNITVQSGGTLIANGTIAQPIYFTSINDESIGAVTNGVLTTPAAGDWDSIYLSGGKAIFNHVTISYGGGPDSLNSGLISLTAANAALTISDSVLSQGLYKGIQTEFGTANVTNCLITGCDRGIQVGLTGPTVVNIINCTLDNNNVGMWAHGGVANLANTIVSDSLTIGIEFCCGSTLSTFEYCDVWSATGVNYSSVADQTGTHGNISANPDFVNAAQGNFELNYASPCINTADGKVAPLTDLTGAPCYNFPAKVGKTGIPNANDVVPDMGAYEFVQNASSDVDLIVSSVTGPVSETAGQTVIVNWNDMNLGTGNAIGRGATPFRSPDPGGTNLAATAVVAQNVVAQSQVRPMPPLPLWSFPAGWTAIINGRST